MEIKFPLTIDSHSDVNKDLLTKKLIYKYLHEQMVSLLQIGTGALNLKSNAKKKTMHISCLLVNVEIASKTLNRINTV